jgi:stress response protein SCP2
MAIQQSYGGTARVQIDEVSDRAAEASNTRLRKQNVMCRVLFDDADEARGWQLSNASDAGRAWQDRLATNLGVRGDAVELDGPTRMEEVDAITLKLDSDSSHILCGACMLYDSHGVCQKVVHYSDRSFAGGVVSHSGDTRVDGKSVHTISLSQSRIPAEVSRLYFTLCSCGPQDLSGFRNPSIMLYDHSEPDANLLEYAIEQAAQSPSCVMARLIRRPAWKLEERVAATCALRRRGVSSLCVDIILAMAADTHWDVEALGSEDWHLKEKICCNYTPAQNLVESKFRE